MKGFKKNGKFIPTEKRNKSSLKKSDIGRQDIQVKKYVPIEQRQKQTLQGISDTELYDALGHYGIDPSGAIGNYPNSQLRRIVVDYRQDMWGE